MIQIFEKLSKKGFISDEVDNEDIFSFTFIIFNKFQYLITVFKKEYTENPSEWIAEYVDLNNVGLGGSVFSGETKESALEKALSFLVTQEKVII